jgi:hypothetical protein
VSSDKWQIALLKENVSLFSQLYVSCQVCDGDLCQYFCHENQSYPPPSLSQYGKLRAGNKSDILVCREKGYPVQAEAPNVDALLLDDAAIVNMIKPGAAILQLCTTSIYSICGVTAAPDQQSQSCVG